MKRRHIDRSARMLALLLFLTVVLVLTGCRSKKDATSSAEEKSAAEAEYAPEDNYADEGGAYGEEEWDAEPVAAAEDMTLGQSAASMPISSDGNAEHARRKAGAQSTAPKRPESADREVEKKKPEPRRMIVYEAWLRVAVDGIAAALREAEVVTARYGGYIESSTLESRVLRIPSGSYAAALEDLQGLGEVRSLRQQSRDVTEAFTDIVARIDNLEALEARYVELLAAAQTVEARLKIERELRRVRQELTELRTQRRVLANKAAFATIELSVEARVTDPIANDDRVQPFAFVSGYGLEEVL